MNVIKPGATIGILGGGQLGRMTALAAAELGYRCHIFSPEREFARRRTWPPRRPSPPMTTARR